MTWSVIVCAYNGRASLLDTLACLTNQDCDEPAEVIVVRSGDKGCEDTLVERFPQVQLVRSDQRMYPGPARNAGLKRARGDYVAFVPDDCVVAPDWLRRRLDKHREGNALVGGSITNGNPESMVGTANYFLEYTALMPSEALLAEQAIPHVVSFERGVFDRHGLYPEDADAGEDTIFNQRCLDAGETLAFEPRAAIAHRNLTGLRESAVHAAAHGRGLVQAVNEGHYTSAVASPDQSPMAAALRLLVVFPSWGLALRTRRLLRHQRPALRRFVPLMPLIAGGLAITGWGALREWRLNHRRGGSPRPSRPVATPPPDRGQAPAAPARPREGHERSEAPSADPR